MSVVKQRLNRRNDDGLYSVIHLETSSDLVKRPNGNDVETDLASVIAQSAKNTPTISTSTPTTIPPGQIVVVANTVYMGGSEGEPIELTKVGGGGSASIPIVSKVPDILEPGNLVMVGNTIYVGDSNGAPVKLLGVAAGGDSEQPGTLQPGEVTIIDDKVYVGDENGNPTEIFTGTDGKYKPTVMDTLPETLEPGQIVIVDGKIYVGDSNGKPIAVGDVLVREELPDPTETKPGDLVIVGDKIYIVEDDGSLVEIGSSKTEIKPDDGGGTTKPTTPIIDVNGRMAIDMLPEVGSNFNWMGFKWRVVHITNKLAYAMLEDVHLVTHFGDSGIYSGSTLQTHATEFQNRYMKDVKDVLVDVTVEGVTAKVFVPTYDQVVNGFDYLKTVANRKANMDNAPTAWWVSTNNNAVPWYVGTDGNMVNTAADTAGFRPFICIDRTKIRIPETGLTFDYSINFGNGIIPSINDKILYGGYNWIVQHLDKDYIYLTLDEIYGVTYFGATNIYAGSRLEAMSDSFLATIDPKTLDTIAALEVAGVTKKVWSPTYTQIMGTFTRTAGVKANRVFKYDGVPTRWWTGTPCADLDCDKVYSVDADGNVVHDDRGKPTSLNGFLPHIAVDRSKVHGMAQALGAVMRWAGYQWIIVHVTDTQITLAMDRIYSMTQFGSNNSYASSTLKTVAKNFENTIDTNLLAQAADTTVNGVTAKIFVASYEQMNGGFSYFNSNDRRICKYNGSAQVYWTSSPYSSGGVYCVATGGFGGSHYGPTYTLGFRPFVVLNRV